MARKKHATDLARALKAPSFENPDASPDLARLDPVSPTTLVLPVADIKAYDHNPRLAENREYPRLKDSIRTRRGLTTPLTVTKRPGDDLYTIGAGGNSRLRALKELAEETGDEAFAFITCRFEPWDSECQVLANHLIENDIRGYILFGDKARAIVQWRDLYEEAHPEEAPLSQRALADCLARSGYRIPQSLLSRLMQASELLMPHLPKAFASGLGRPAVEQLIRLRQMAQKYWDERAGGTDASPEGDFDQAFSRTCAAADCHYQDWDYELFQNAFALELARSLRLDHKIVSLDLDSLYHGYPVDLPAIEAPPRAKDAQGLSSDWAYERLRESEAGRAERVRARLGIGGAIRESSVADALEPAGSPSSDSASSQVFKTPPTDSGRLRQANYAVARRLAGAQGLEDLVRPIETGFGFYIEAPDPPESRASSERLESEEKGVVFAGSRSIRWWFLCLAADQLEPLHLAAIAGAHPASWLVELFTELPANSSDTDPLSALEILVGRPSRTLVWEVLTDPDLASEETALLAELTRGCRTLRVSTADERHQLWASQ